ncbi:3-oxoacyl-[acyl-carrier-protein] reductase FabG [compost metagenome]
MSLQGKVALVTGASRGIGQAIALELGRQGAIVVGTATSASGAERIAATLKENGIQGTGLELNVTSDESVAAVLAASRSSLVRRRSWSTMPVSPAIT